MYYFKRGQVWYVMANGSQHPSACFIFGDPGDIGVIGTWGGAAKNYPTPGVFRPSTGQWFFDGTEFGSTAVATRTLGGPGDIPVVGDWNRDGTDDIGVVRGSTWYLQTDSTSTIAQGTRTFGLPTDIPVSGGVDGNGGFGHGSLWLAVFRPSTRTFIERDDLGDLYSTPIPAPGDKGDEPVVPYADESDPVNFDLAFGPSVYRPSTATLYASSIFDGDLSWDSGTRVADPHDQVLSSGVVCDVAVPCSYP